MMAICAFLVDGTTVPGRIAMIGLTIAAYGE